MILTND